MPAIRGVTISVGYAQTLAICLPANMRHMTECVVATSPEDEATQAVARSVPGVRLFISDAFRRHGARFNKGLLMEEALDFLGRDGWILIHDADILLPDDLPLDTIAPGHLYGLRRRVLDNPARYRPSLNWNDCPVHRDGNAPIGFAQLFHGSDPMIAGRRPWYDVSFPHAGGCDAYFLYLWPRHLWRILPAECLHLGKVDVNWFGTDQESRDLMAKFVWANGWGRAMQSHTPEAAARAGELPGRVEVPGYERSTYELPFVRRLQGQVPRGV